MSSAALVFPHQLFKSHPALTESVDCVAIIEDSLFFGDRHHPLKFHQQKLWLHRATMKRYAAFLQSQGLEVHYTPHCTTTNPLQSTLQMLAQQGVNNLALTDPVDFLLEKRLHRHAAHHSLTCTIVNSPGFINDRGQNDAYRKDRSRWYMADFYQHQRRRLDILMNGDEPLGGKWSFDEDNRKKVPKKLLDQIPELPKPETDDFDQEAVKYVKDRFSDHPGNLDRLYFPTSHRAAERWLQSFLQQRLHRFGDYEDAIVANESWLWHGVLSPLLNTGLLTPMQVVNEATDYALKNDIPLNSIEGFVRQIIGWREFIRATYDDLGVVMRTTNHWKHHRKIPTSFWDATTGIDPIDDCIGRLNQTGYLHHIERLMVIGGFMFLCEFDPEEIYKWFMELFVDSYDWVMVPNVYAMSQNADGGHITTKPYFSGSAYIKKMSHYKHGPWADVWDGLYWSWIGRHREKLAKNHRWAMMCKMSERMDESKRQIHEDNARQFLAKLDSAPKYF